MVVLFCKQAAEKVRIDNLPESELQALLDEVLQYSGKRDGEKGSELFQVCLLFSINHFQMEKNTYNLYKK